MNTTQQPAKAFILMSKETGLTYYKIIFMKKLIVILSLLFCSLSARAMSLHPCTPIIQANAAGMTCFERASQKTYSIKLNVFMSDRSRGCTEKNNSYYEHKTAKVNVRSSIDGTEEILSFGIGEFNYSYDPAFFSAKDLNLTDCRVEPNDEMQKGN